MMWVVLGLVIVGVALVFRAARKRKGPGLRANRGSMLDANVNYGNLQMQESHHQFHTHL